MRGEFGHWAVAALALALGSQAFGQTRFFDGLTDVPLAPGLQAQVEAGLAFEGPEGRILIAAAVGDLPADQHFRWYETALPGLGWAPAPAPAGVKAFARGQERLEIHLGPAAAGRTRLEFRLIVRPAVDPAPR